MPPEWLSYVDEKRQASLVNVLQELSDLQNKKDLNFIIIGALPLLISGYLKYKVYWDVDLLFKDKDRLKEFIGIEKSSSLRIFNYDDDMMVSENITSLHTAWTFHHTWVNVDYILRKDFFEFYTHYIFKSKPYIKSIKLDDKDYRIDLYFAHPWDIIIEKIVSPRMKKDLDLKVDMSIDIRHIYAIYEKEKNNIHFWNYVFEKAKYLHKVNRFKGTFLKLLSTTKELGYSDIEISSFSIKMLKEL